MGLAVARPRTAPAPAAAAAPPPPPRPLLIAAGAGPDRGPAAAMGPELEAAGEAAAWRGRVLRDTALSGIPRD